MPFHLFAKRETVTLTIASIFWNGEDMVGMVMPFPRLGKEENVTIITISNPF